jgi:hypothetical protein
MRPARAAAVALWAVAAVAAGAWLALVEVFWLPLRVAGVLLPVSIPAAVVGNLMLTGLYLRASGSRLVATLPALTWLVVVVAAMVRRPEGDLVITGGGATGIVNLAFLLTGVLAAAFAVGRVLGAGPPAPVRGSPEPVAAPAGSGSGGAR